MNSIPQIRAIIAHLTDGDLARYVAQHCAWVTPKQARRSNSIHVSAAIEIYAGRNPMAHYDRRISLPGMGGASQVFTGMFSADRAKYLAGEWLVSSRRCRARGDIKGALLCLDKAHNLRIRAMTLSAQPQTFQKGRAA